MNLDDAKQFAAEYNKKLRSDDPRFQQRVLIIHQDNTIHFFSSAFIIKKEHFVIVFAEHEDPHVFHSEDLSRFEAMAPCAPSDP